MSEAAARRRRQQRGRAVARDGGGDGSILMTEVAKRSTVADCWVALSGQAMHVRLVLFERFEVNGAEVEQEVFEDVDARKGEGGGVQKIFEMMRMADTVLNVVTFNKVGDGMQEI